MRWYRIALPLLALTMCLPACEQLSPLEKQQYENLLAQGAPQVREKNPWIAGSLNLILGFGDIYNGQWGAFALDLLLWWPSVIWAVPQGAITAVQTNKKATIAYYIAGPGAGQFDPNRAVRGPTDNAATGAPTPSAMPAGSDSP